MAAYILNRVSSVSCAPQHYAPQSIFYLQGRRVVLHLYTTCGTQIIVELVDFLVSKVTMDFTAMSRRRLGVAADLFGDGR